MSEESDKIDALRISIARAKGWKFWALDEHPEQQYACEPGELPDPMGYGHKMHPIDRVTSHWVFDDDQPNWTGNIADAWELVEEMNEAGIWQLSNGDGDTIDFDFFPYLGMTHSIHTEGLHNAPEAICRAWLEWKEKGA